MTSSLIDESARQIIRTQFDQTLFVEAGAGTGKTTELVARIVGLLASGRARVEQIAAITFTEAAAGELRERVRVALQKAVLHAKSIERERLQLALHAIESAPIQTIHAFAQRILQLVASEAGLPPVFRVVDEVGASQVFRARWQRFLKGTVSSAQELSKTDEELFRTGFALGLNIRQMRALAKQLDGHWDRLEVWKSKQSVLCKRPQLDVSHLVAVLREVESRLHGCMDKSDLLFARLQDVVIPWFHRLQVAVSEENTYAALTLLQEAPTFPARAGNAKRWTADALAEIREFLSDAAAAREAALLPVKEWVAQGLLLQLSEFATSAARQRQLEGQLEFNDLLIIARDVLRDSSAARNEVRTRFTRILVDEFQDTDPLQAEIIQFLTADEVNSPATGAQFTVGDPKQSIYRFRNADIHQYLAIRNANPSAVVSLTTNFRTLKNIVEWNNQAFASLLQGIDVELQVGRHLADGSDDAGSVTVLGGPLQRGVVASQIRRLEAEEIVTSIRQACDEGWKVHEGSAIRPARYSDVAVLIPTRSSLPALERAFRQSGIPYRVESRSLIWQTQEVRDVLAILRAVVNPRDEVAVLAALRTSALACADDHLLTWKASGGEWDYRQAPLPDLAQHQVAIAMTSLREWHEKKWNTSVPELLDDVVTTTGMFETAFARKRRRETWNRLRFIIDATRAWFEQEGGGLSSFVTWAHMQQEQGADARELVVAESDDDSVRVMTIHAAKGLEFPITMLCGLGSKGNRAESARVLWSVDESGMSIPEVRIGAKSRNWETAGFTSAERRDASEDMDEQARLLYVGATRARDHLLIGAFHRSEKTPTCLAARLLHATQDVPTFAPVGLEVPTSMNVEVDVTAIQASKVQTFAVWQQRHASAIAQGSRIPNLSATAVRRLITGDSLVLPGSRLEHETNSEQDLAAKLAFGRAVHAAMESASLVDAEKTETAIQQAAEKEGLSHRVQDVKRSIELALAAEPIRNALSSERFWREAFVSAEIADLVLEGYIDLLYETSEGCLAIVDYKTDFAADPSEAKELLQHYQWQLLTYALALQSSIKKKIASAALVLISPQQLQPMVIEVEDLDMQMQQLAKGLPNLSVGTHLVSV